MSAALFARAAVRRLLDALCTGDPAAVLDAGALVCALVASAADVASAVRRATAVLDVVLLAPGVPLPEAVRRCVEDTIAALARETTTPAAVAERLARLWRALADIRTPPPCAPPLAAAVHDFLASNLSGRACLHDVARALGYSPSHVSDVIRRTTGRRFTQLRRDMRLERALFFLRRGANVKRAAFEAGFGDPAYFTRVFARRFGVPPSRWREAAGGPAAAGARADPEAGG